VKQIMTLQRPPEISKHTSKQGANVQSPIKVTSERPELASQARLVGRRPAIAREIFRALIRLFIGILIAVSATLAWQSYSDEAEKLVSTWAPAAAWLLPVSPLESPADHESAQDGALSQSAPVAQKLAPAVTSSDSAQQLEPITRDLAAVRSSLEQLAVNQGQMAEVVSSSDSARQLEPITRDLAAVRSSLEHLAANQEQMAKNVATLQAAVEQGLKEKMSAQLPSQAVPLPQRKPPHAAR